MDRRTLLAFALLTIVVILYLQLAPKPAPPSPPAAASSTNAPGQPASTQPENSPNAAPQSAGLAPNGGAAGRAGSPELRNILPPGPEHAALQFDSGLYHARLSPTGGLITSWRLGRYTDSEERPADLVADSSAGMFRLGLVLDRGDIDLSRTRFQVSPGPGGSSEGTTLLARDSSGATVRLEYRFPHDRYDSELKVHVDGFPGGNGKQFLQLDFPAGIAYVERDSRFDFAASAGVALLGERYVKHRMGRGAWREDESGMVHWAGVRSKYFLLAALPQGTPDGEVSMVRDGETKAIRTILRVPLNLSGSTDVDFRIFGGPMQYRILESLGAGLEKTVDLGWRVIVPFSKLLLRFFAAVHNLLPNYGVVILVLSVLTKVLFYPLTKKSMESMKQMQLLKPELDRLNEKFKDDPQRRNQATLELYKKNKVNPLGGCLPVLIQMPVFVALYNVLNSSIELRKAPFMLWIRDLSAPDRVGQVFGFPIHILPLVMAATMFWQQKLTPTDPRQAGMTYMMPIIMTVFFYTLPSGLVFYWTVNNVMSVGQQIWMNRNMGYKPVAA